MLTVGIKKRNREGSSTLCNDQDIEFNYSKLPNLDSITDIRIFLLDDKNSNKKYVNDSIGYGSIPRFNQTLENYLKVPVGKDAYNLTKFDKIQLTDTTIFQNPNTGGRTQNFTKSTTTNILIGNSGATSLPAIGSSFMQIEGPQMILVIMYSLVLKEQIRCNLVISVFIILDF